MVDFSVDPVCEGDTFSFRDNSFVDQTIFSDNLSPSNSTSPIFNFAGITSSNTTPGYWPNGPPPIGNLWNLPTENFAFGEYDVTLTRQSESPYECINEITKPVIIKLKPNINYTVTSGGQNFPNYLSACGPDIIFDLEGNHYDLTQNHELRYTLFDDLMNPHSPPIPPNNSDIQSYQFNRTGIYYLEIALNNMNGCGDTSIYNIFLNPNPYASFNASQLEGCEKLCVDFVHNSTVPNDGTGGIFSEINRWEWNLGYGSSTQIYYPGNIDTCYMSYDSPYDVTLKVITDSYCTDISEITTIKVLPTPIPDFVTNLNGSLPGGNGIYLFDGTISTTTNGDSALPPAYSYEWTIEDGNYFINVPDDVQLDGREDKGYYSYNSLIDDAWLQACLKLENVDNGCWDSICKDVRIDHFNNLIVPNFMYPTDQSSGASEFLPKGKSLGIYRLQIFDKFGNLLWETSDLDENGSPTTGWDGTSLDGEVPQGTYVWRIKATYIDGEPWKGMLIDGKRVQSGIITLVR